ncbi:MAG: MFS transporter [Gammaproteobacteria bacterium]|nr:MFS transporter [Gammaproteobacteria bacterium]MYF29802.1 MFS transporter [Gammaproteobacteria bacterium]MYK46337.1 MFS transporter [Gammaproteobacteria bacterium]
MNGRSSLAHRRRSRNCSEPGTRHVTLVLSEQRWLRFGAFSAFYFAQGVPIGLLSVAMPAWLAEQQASVGEIALFTSVVSIPWAFKLVAGPFMDRLTFLPMGFRRPWVLVAQAGLTVCLVAVALTPFDVGALGPLVVVGFATNAFAATQDVAVDGMAIDVLPVDERGRANAFMAFGQVAGSSSFGALCGTLLPLVGLQQTASLCAATVAVIFVFVALVRERPGERLLPWTAGETAQRAEATAARVVDNFRDLLRVLALPMSVVLVAASFAYFLRGGLVRLLSARRARYAGVRGVCCPGSRSIHYRIQQIRQRIEHCGSGDRRGARTVHRPVRCEAVPHGGVDRRRCLSRHRGRVGGTHK